MATETMIEKRLEAVEEAIEELKRRFEDRPSPPNWLDQVIGTFKDVPEFDEVIRLGREFRLEKRPSETERL
jgi:hypothetical protein